jgi:hypothetical protein
VKYVETAERAHALLYRCAHTRRIADVTADSNAATSGFRFDFTGKSYAFLLVQIHQRDRCTVSGQRATKGFAQNA